MAKIAFNLQRYFQNRFRFFLPRFGTAKVVTYFIFANFIFYFLFAFSTYNPLFRFLFGGLQKY
jgi:hypothetical protein